MVSQSKSAFSQEFGLERILLKNGEARGDEGRGSSYFGRMTFPRLEAMDRCIPLEKT